MNLFKQQTVQISMSELSPQDMRKMSQFIAGLLILLTIVFESTTNLFLQCLPTMQEHFSSSSNHIQLMLSSYLFGFAILGLISGPLSDSFGRKPLMLVGLCVFWLGSYCCYLFAETNLTILIIARFLQGLGAGMSTVLVNAICKDLFDEISCARILSVMDMIIAMAPMIAPMMGALIAELYGWPTIFTLMFISASGLFLLFFFKQPETLSNKKKFNVETVLKNYKEIIKNPYCRGYAAVSGLAYGALFAWLTHAPFFFYEHFDFDNVSYAIFSAIGPCGYMVGALTNILFVKRYGILKMLRLGLFASLIGIIGLLFLTLSKSHSILCIAFFFVIFNIGVSPVFSNAETKAIDVKEYKRGAASAFLASIEQCMAGTSTFIVSFFAPLDIHFSVVLMLLMIVISFYLSQKLYKRKALSLAKAEQDSVKVEELKVAI